MVIGQPYATHLSRSGFYLIYLLLAAPCKFNVNLLFRDVKLGNNMQSRHVNRFDCSNILTSLVNIVLLVGHLILLNHIRITKKGKRLTAQSLKSFYPSFYFFISFIHFCLGPPELSWSLDFRDLNLC